MWSDKGFEETMVDAKEKAETLDIETLFSSELPVRPRKIKRQFDYESHYETTVNVDPKKAFKSNVFFYALDRTIMSLDKRCGQLKAHYNIFGFLYSTKNQENDGLVQKCKDMQLTLTYEGHLGADGTQLHQELIVFHSLSDAAKSSNDPLELLKNISTSSLCGNIPSLTVALRILLTRPVTVASGERSF
ncbi:hypothetical protein PR048_023653 [Dryococelus australis]|uniref:Uncharacterized protein n=1 Tax=Dryococelus australis TaxID=614101 RepID=A0ABQ9GUW1_9NEOP|nr:hypothetical protein PR048_023653 [Dryococelus australis]